MKKVSILYMCFLDLILVALALIVATIFPGKANSKALNNGTLRQYSATAAGVDQDAFQGIGSCIPEADVSNSCTATAATGSTTANTSRDANGLQTDANTSVTGSFPGEQTSLVI